VSHRHFGTFSDFIVFLRQQWQGLTVLQAPSDQEPVAMPPESPCLQALEVRFAFVVASFLFFVAALSFTVAHFLFFLFLFFLFCFSTDYEQRCPSNPSC
jgi:hypothetical protein